MVDLATDTITAVDADPFAIPGADVDTWNKPLRNAVTLGSASYSSITLREPTGAEWLLWESLSGLPASMKAISVVAGVPEAVVKQMVSRDINDATKFLDRFF